MASSNARRIGDAETRKSQKKTFVKGKAVASSSHEDVSIVVEAFEDINEPLAFEGVDMVFARLLLMNYVAGPEVTANALESLTIVRFHLFHWVILVVYFLIKVSNPQPDEDKYFCDICAVWPGDIPLPPKFTKKSISSWGNVQRHRSVGLRGISILRESHCS